MRGTLRIFRTLKFSESGISEFMKMSLPVSREFHFLLTDGIMLNLDDLFPGDLLSSIQVQRILTSYQLQKILMDSDDLPYYIVATSPVMETWPSAVIEGIYDIMKIKSYYHGSIIFLHIVGNGGIFEKYLGNRILAGRSAGSRGGLYSWDEQFRL